MKIYTYSEATLDSPLDVGGINLDLTRQEVVDLVRSGRRRTS
jgi:hypothetical protein